VKIRTRAFLLGLLPTLLVAAVLTAFHVYTRLSDLDATTTQQGMAVARHLASSAEYGVLSGNTAALEKLLDQALEEPGVRTAMVVWPDKTRVERGDPVRRVPPLSMEGQWQSDTRSWFSHPVVLSSLLESDPYVEGAPSAAEPLAWIAISMDLQQKQSLAQTLLLASLGISLLGIALAILLINKLALTGVQPLLDIISSVKRISSGSFGTSMAVTARSPELRELQSMVNHMSESLRSYQHDMEARIHAATAALEHKKREAELASLAKSRFLATASHDLRQPMHAISLYVESLKPQMQGRAAQDVLNKIERAILSTVELFNAILDVTKLDAGVVQPQLAPVRIRQLFLHLAEEFAPEAERKRLSLRVRAPDVWIESDGILLERICRNLLSNALLHTTHGGVLLSARPYGERLRLQIWDTGCGIAPEHQARVFDEFYQAGPKDEQIRHGLGLGLAIVRRLARLLDHPLQMHSSPGQGTVFSLDVPRLTNDAPAGEEAGETAHVDLDGHVVIVDDDPDVRDALGKLLTQWGLEVQLLSDLHQVRHYQYVAPDVVLADYQLLKGETGLDAIAIIRARWGARIPAILITGDTRSDTVQLLTSLGHAVLYKPIRPAQLLALLRKFFSGRSTSELSNPS
jgi:two-component system, sensor histidine kinase